MNKFWSSNLLNLKPYVPGEQPVSNINTIKLNTNENPYPPSPKIKSAVLEYIQNENIALYPDPNCTKLKKLISKQYSIPTQSIFCGNGSDEILNLIIKAFLEPLNEHILIPFPNYFLYEVLAQGYGVRYSYTKQHKNLDIQFDELINSNSKIIFISNPNSPTGRLHKLNDIDKLATNYKGLIVIDEAYIDFANNHLASALNLINKHNNIIVVRTFSKAFSLASIRLGYAFSSPNIIQGLMSIKDSYNVSSLTQLIGSVALQDYDYMKDNVAKIVNTKSSLVNSLETLGFQIIPSQANFIFCSHKDIYAKRIFNFLKEHNILVRYFDQLGNYIRISIGNDAQIQKLIHYIKLL